MLSKEEKLHQLRKMISSVESSSVNEAHETSRESGSFHKEEANERKIDAFQRVVKLTSSRFRSEKDIRQRLSKDGYSQNEIDEAISRAVRCLLIDDLRYADVLIRSRVRQGRGKRGIELELFGENIDTNLISGWPDEYFSQSGDEEIERAIALLDRKPPRSKNLRASAYRKLIQKGYSTPVAQIASKRWCEEAY